MRIMKSTIKKQNNSLAESKAYILGTDSEELFRLGVQHQVWAEEAQKGWRLANFSAGQTLLDLGCGPGYCTKELAFISCYVNNDMRKIKTSILFKKILDTIDMTHRNLCLNFSSSLYRNK